MREPMAWGIDYVKYDYCSCEGNASAQIAAYIGFGQNGRERFAGPGHWNDPDILEVGNGKMDDVEYHTHMSLWSLLAVPLLAGNDLSHMKPDTLAILTNPEVLPWIRTCSEFRAGASPRKAPSKCG
jgi:hypothetical protein